MQQVEMEMNTAYLEGVRFVQREWAAAPVSMRVRVMAKLRRRIASGARELAETVPTELPGALSRTVADTLASEVLPLIEACRFLERDAAGILRTKRLGAGGRPLWLGGVDSRVERAPLGIVLVIGAANYPLFLAGVQTVQALVAGNAVLWKPAPGTETPAFALRTMLIECGLNPELLTLLDPGPETAAGAISQGVDHVVLTGSAEAGKAVMRQLAETLTPATMELSGCDAVFVLPGADLDHAARSVTFGLRFNGSFTCMAPRRVFLVGMPEADAEQFEARLALALEEIESVLLPPKTMKVLDQMIADARAQGAEVRVNGIERWSKSGENRVGVTLMTRATPSMLSMQTDIFAPVLSIMRTADTGEALAAHAASPFALTAAVFGPEGKARAFAAKLPTGNVLINDLIIPTADPRIPFGGRGRSGFGVTRGAEGLLSMTRPRSIQLQRSRSKRAYEPAGELHLELFASLAELLHGVGIRRRWSALKRVLRAGRKINSG
jgi:acyl-CoA reductase-like NAD-dependent aldehyde dehydrogenase